MIDTISGHLQKKDGKWEVKVQWHTGETTWNPMELIKTDDNFSLTAYSRENQLLITPNVNEPGELQSTHKSVLG